MNTPGSAGAVKESTTRGSRSMLRTFRYRLMCPLTRSSPSRPTQMTLTWGLPSGLIVLRWASGPASITVRSSSGRAAMTSLSENSGRWPNSTAESGHQRLQQGPAGLGRGRDGLSGPVAGAGQVGDDPGDPAQRPGGQHVFQPLVEFVQRDAAVRDGGAEHVGGHVAVGVRRQQVRPEAVVAVGTGPDGYRDDRDHR